VKTDNIFNLNSNGMFYVAICIVLAGLLVYSISSAFSSPFSVVEETVIDNSSNQMEWWPEETTTIADSSTIIHSVKSGDCVYNLAKKYKTTVKRIASWNRLANSSKISVGQELIVGYDVKSRIIKSEIDIKKPEYEPKRQADVEQLSLSLSLYYTSKREEFPFYISEYVKSNSNENDYDNNRNGNKLATKNTFTQSKNLSFFEKLDVVNIKYNTADNQQYSIQEIAESTVGKLIHRMGGNYSWSSGKLLADCGDYRALLISAWTGKKIKDNTTSTIFRNAKNFDPDQIKIGTEVGWTEFVSKKTGKIVHGHVYVYIGDGQFANLSSKKKGVFFASLEKIQYLAKIYTMKMTS